LEGKADEPWFMLDILGCGDNYQTVGRRMAELDAGWSVRVECGFFDSEKISKL
jgi:hypothetical protein